MNFDDLIDDRDEGNTGSTPQGSAPSGAPQLNFDELPDDRYQTPQAPVEDREQAGLSFDDLQDDRTAAPEGERTGAGEEAGGLGSFAREGARAIPAGIVGGAAGFAAAGPAAAASLPFAPLAGPLAPAVPIVAGGLAALLAGGAASALVTIGEDKLLALMGFDDKQHLADQETLAGKAGNVAGNVLPGFGLGKGAMLGARAVGGALMGGVSAGQQYVQTGSVDPTETALNVAAGAAFPQPRTWMTRVASYRGGNKNPDLKPVPEHEQGVAPEDDITVNDAPALTAEETNLANDVTTTAPGVAAPNDPPPEIPGTGNPGKAAGQAHEAAPPNSRERNFAKDQPPTHPELSDNKIIDTEPLKSDIQAALTEEAHTQSVLDNGAEVQRREAGTDVLPPLEAAPTNPEPSNAVPRAEPVAEVPAADHQAAPEPLTPAERKSLAEDRQILMKAGWDRALAALDKVSERKQVEVLRQAANTIRGEQAEKPSTVKEVRRPGAENTRKETRLTNSIGMQARDRAELTHHEHGIKLRQAMYTEFGPQSEKGKAIDINDTTGVKDYAKQVWAEAVHRNNGKDPLNRSETYTPTTKGHALTAELEWLRGIRDAKNGDGLKRLAFAHSTEGKAADLAAETARIKGDIDHRPHLEEPAAESATATGALEHNRTSFEHLEPDPRPNADNSYVEDHNKLADWLNERSPTEYEKLSENYDLRTEMDEPADPRELLSAMKQTLADTGRRPKGEITTEVDLPPKKVDLPILPQAKEPTSSTVRVLDKNSDEFKRLAAQYTSEPVKPKAAAGEKLAQLAEAEKTTEKLETRPSEQSVFNTLRRLAADESGSLNFVQAIAQHMQKQSAKAALRASTAAPGPQANAAMKAYSDNFAKLVQDDMHAANATVIHTMDDIRKLYANAKVEAKRLGMTDKDMKAMDLAGQRDKLGTLPPEHQKFYREVVQPLRDLDLRQYREIRDLNGKYDLGLDLPDPDQRGIAVQYAPRHRSDTLLWDRKQDDMFDPFSNRTLGGYSPNLELRGLKALHDVGNDPSMSNLNGDRLIISVEGDKKNGFEVSILRKGQRPVKLKNLPAGFDGELGNVLPLKVKGKASRWQVDHAATDEIEKATGGKVKYLEDPVSNWAQAAESTAKALEQIKLRVKIMESDPFKNLTTKSREEAETRGYDPKFTRLKEFGDLYMPKQLKWTFDDWAKPGFGGDNIIDKLRSFNQGVAKFININAPLVHVWNEATQIIVARGYRNFWPPSYYRIGRVLPEAVRSVNSQDALQREMRRNGAHPQLAATLARGMHHDWAAMMGMDMTKNASQWDPVAKMFNMTTPQAFDKVHKASSDVTWRLSDYMATAHYLELKAEGYKPKEAAEKLNKFFSTYQVGTTLLGMRGLQQFAVDPATTLFGRYKANILQSFYHIGNGMLHGTPAEKAEAFSQALTLGALGLFGFSAIDKGLEKLTGMEGIELRPRGMVALPAAVGDMVTGKKSAAAALTQMWSPGPVAQAAFDLHGNKDFRGKDIVPQGDWLEHPSIPLEGVGKVAEYGARQFMSPYSSASQAYGRDDDEGGIKGAAKAFGLEQFGVSVPSERARAYEEKAPKINERNMRTRYKRPDSEGVIPGIIHRFTE